MLMHRIKEFIPLLLLLAAVFVFCGCGTDKAVQMEEPADAEELKVGFVYVGPVGDAGWSYAHDQGRLYLEENVDGIVTVFAESVLEGPDAQKVMIEMVEQGCRVIFATSFGYMNAVINVAEKYPGVIFEHCSGYKTASNVANYFGRMYQPRYLTGIAAGMKTESNIIGYVAAFPIPEVVRGINAFTLGVRSVNPGARVHVAWTNTWYDPPLEKETALGLLDLGADVIAQHQDTPGPQQAAEERGAWGISYNSDMRDFAPQATMTGPVWNWGPYYVDVVKSVMDGTWERHEYWGSMADGIVDIASFNDNVVGEDIKEAVLGARELILSGELKIFDGPINDQNGDVKLPEGASMTDGEKLSFDWFVEGVVGTL